MKKLFKFLGILTGLAILVVLITMALMPWMDRYGATVVGLMIITKPCPTLPC